MLRMLRIVLALAFFAGLNLFFFGFAAGLGGLVRIQLVPALLAVNLVVLAVLAALTCVLGRVYCSVLCPLGIFQDIVLWLRRRIRPVSFSSHPARVGVRATFAFVFAALLGGGCVSLAGILDPYSAYGRIATHLFEPLVASVANLVARAATEAGEPCMLVEPLMLRGCAALALAGVTFLALVVMAARRGRLFCNTVCPVGTLLGALSACAPVKIRLDPAKCVKCGLCARRCKAECIDLTTGRVDQTRCVRCLDCLSTCRKGAITWR